MVKGEIAKGFSFVIRVIIMGKANSLFKTLREVLTNKCGEKCLNVIHELSIRCLSVVALFGVKAIASSHYRLKMKRWTRGSL